jgi:CRP/FNR family cyclic AMP-dependent transcriptional regulator
MAIDPYWGNIFKRKSDQEKSDLEVLSQIPLFEGMSGKDLYTITHFLHERTFSENEKVMEEGKTGLGLYIILQGRVDIILGDDDQEKTLAILGPGEFFGEMALLQEAPRSASAIAREECRTYGMFQPDLFSIIESKPKLGNKILLILSRMIAERLRYSNQENHLLRKKIEDIEGK